MTARSPKEFLAVDDPLSDEAFESFIRFREEDSVIDYKETFDFSEREWLKITKDVMALANTEGGYLVFGIRDKTFEVVGLPDEDAAKLTDTDTFMMKVNRYIEPKVTMLRSKRHAIENGPIVAIYVPASTGKTHFVSKDAFYKLPSGEKKCELHEGTFYTRKSGGNELGNPLALDRIFETRMALFRERLLRNIGKIVEAPLEAEVYLLAEDGAEGNAKKFVIVDAPDAQPVKGLSFTIAPRTREEEVAAWIAMALKDAAAIPPASTLWKWYYERDIIALNTPQRLRAAEFCLLRGVPAFYWLHECSAPDIRKMLSNVIVRSDDLDAVIAAVRTSAFLGRSTHKALLDKAAPYHRRFSPDMLAFPQEGPRSLFCSESYEKLLSPKGVGTNACATLVERLNAVIAPVVEGSIEEPGAMQRWEALSLDCILYARTNGYHLPK